MSYLAVVTEKLLFTNQLNQQDVLSVLTDLTKSNVDYADIYCQSIFHESWFMENKKVKSGSYHIDQGMSVRVVSGTKTGFAYADQMSLAALQQSATTAANIVDITSSSFSGSWKKNINIEKEQSFYTAIAPQDQFSVEQKIALLNHVDKLCRQLDRRINEVMVNISSKHEHILIAATDGTLSADIRPLIRFSITVLIEDNGKRESGSSGGGGRYGYDYLLQADAAGVTTIDQFAHKAVLAAQISLVAQPAPAGMMPVVLGPGWPAVLLHEAIGHGLEGDFNRRGSSLYTGKLGQPIASNLCTVVDDATVPGLRGSLSIDDEGVPGQRTTLITEGVLTGYMQDKFNAHLMGTSSTGNCRRESYACLPMPRMTNTYLLPGKSTPEEIINSVDHGLYAPNFSGGQVDITSGKFVFTTTEAYLIEKGKITIPVKGAVLIGSGVEVMQNITMVGNDLLFDPGIGICGKEGQSVPVSVGQPTLKISGITVGGSK